MCPVMLLLPIFSLHLTTNQETVKTCGIGGRKGHGRPFFISNMLYWREFYCPSFPPALEDEAEGETPAV